MYQKITLIGRCGKNPEQRLTADGDPVTVFSLATSSRKGETAWFRITVFGKQAQACGKYIFKGDKVYVEGRLNYDLETGSPRLWQDQNGTYRTSFEVVASQVVFLSDAKTDEDVAL